MDKEYRQVVSDASITSSKSYNDFLYGWLVINANIEDDVAYFWKRDFVFSKLETELGMTRKTLAKYFGGLIDLGLVEEREDKWVLVELGSKGFSLEEEILGRLVETKERYLITLYVYLKKGKWLLENSGKEDVPVLLGPIKRYIGVNDNSTGNNYVITDLFEEMRALGLLQWKLVNGRAGNRHFYLISGIGEEYYF